MIKKIILFLAIEVFFAIAVFIFTKNDFDFHTSATITLNEEYLKSSPRLSYNQNYEIDHPMKYLMNIQNPSGTISATLIWPTAPLGKFLLLVPYQSHDLQEMQRFEGRLVRCLYKCVVNEMYIEMFEFVKSIENKFPEFKGKFNDLPSIVINTAEKPLGLKAYFILTQNYWIGFGVLFVLGLGLLIWRLLR